jgi:hypothetical protein
MILQQLATTNPSLFEYVKQHPDQLAAALNEGIEEGDEEPEEIELNDDEMEELGLGELGEMEGAEESESVGEEAAGDADAIRRVPVGVFSSWNWGSAVLPQWKPTSSATGTKKWLPICSLNVRQTATSSPKALTPPKEMIHIDVRSHLKIIMGCFQGNPSQPRSFQLGKTQLIRQQKLAEGAYGDVWQCRVAGTETLLALK